MADQTPRTDQDNIPGTKGNISSKFIKEKTNYEKMKAFDNYTGYNWTKEHKLQDGTPVKVAKDHHLELSTGKIGQYKNSQPAGDFISKPKSVGYGRLSKTKFEDPIDGLDLEQYKR